VGAVLFDPSFENHLELLAFAYGAARSARIAPPLVEEPESAHAAE